MEDLIKEYAQMTDPDAQEAVELLQLYKDRPGELLKHLDRALQDELAGSKVFETLYMDLLAYLQ